MASGVQLLDIHASHILSFEHKGVLGRITDGSDRPKKKASLCWKHLAEGPVRIVFNVHFQLSFDCILGVVGAKVRPLKLHSALADVGNPGHFGQLICRVSSG